MLAFKGSSPQEKTEDFSESDRFRACGVFKTATAYKVVTEYNLDYGYYQGLLEMLEGAFIQASISQLHKLLY